jgi:endoglycosylceramidase
MKHIALAIGVLALFCACGGRTITAPAVPPMPSPQPSSGLPSQPLGHIGRFLTDSQGRVLILHGVNMINKFPPYDLASIGFDERDADLLQRSGLNVVRVGVIYAGVEPEPGRFDDAYLASIASTVAMLGRHGILSLLDFHQDIFAAPFTGEGFPAWSVYDNGLPLKPNFGFPADYIDMPSLQAAYDNFWMNRAGPGGVGLQERYSDGWAHVAAYFRGNPAVLGYDIFNEPFPGTNFAPCETLTGCKAFDRTVLSPFAHKTARAIQAVDPDHFVFYEPLIFFDYGAGTSEIGPPGERVGFSYHDYNAKNYPLPIANALKQSAKYGDALLMTEFGASATPGPVTEVADLMDANMLSWIYWTYRNQTPYKIIVDGRVTDPAKQGIVISLRAPLSGSNVNRAVLTALARPYPTVIAGMPLSFAFDLLFVPAGTSVANRETDVAMPPASYPNGYVATARGCKIVSSRNASVLRVQSGVGTLHASVHVRRRDV